MILFFEKCFFVCFNRFVDADDALSVDVSAWWLGSFGVVGVVPATVLGLFFLSRREEGFLLRYGVIAVLKTMLLVIA